MLEMYDLAISLNSDVHLTLHKEDKAGEQIECAVSYKGKNIDMCIDINSNFVEAKSNFQLATLITPFHKVPAFHLAHGMDQIAGCPLLLIMDILSMDQQPVPQMESLCLLKNLDLNSMVQLFRILIWKWLYWLSLVSELK